jgi:hypothetical protein
LLTLEISFAQESSHFTLDAEIVRAIHYALRSDLHHIVHATTNYTSMNCFPSFSEAYECFSKVVQVSLLAVPGECDVDSILYMCRLPINNFPVGGTGNEYIKKAILLWVTSVTTDLGSDSGSSLNHFLRVDIELDRMWNILLCLRSWKSFLHMLYSLLKQWQTASPDATLFRISQSTLLQNVAMEVLRSYHYQVDMLEQSQTKSSSTLLTQSGHIMTKLLSGLLLDHVTANDLPLVSSRDEWLESLCLITDISKKMLSSHVFEVRLLSKRNMAVSSIPFLSERIY